MFGAFGEVHYKIDDCVLVDYRMVYTIWMSVLRYHGKVSKKVDLVRMTDIFEVHYKMAYHRMANIFRNIDSLIFLLRSNG